MVLLSFIASLSLSFQSFFSSHLDHWTGFGPFLGKVDFISVWSIDGLHTDSGKGGRQFTEEENAFDWDHLWSPL